MSQCVCDWQFPRPECTTGNFDISPKRNWRLSQIRGFICVMLCCYAPHVPDKHATRKTKHEERRLRREEREEGRNEGQGTSKGASLHSAFWSRKVSGTLARRRRRRLQERIAVFAFLGDSGNCLLSGLKASTPRAVFFNLRKDLQ